MTCRYEVVPFPEGFRETRTVKRLFGTEEETLERTGDHRDLAARMTELGQQGYRYAGSFTNHDYASFVVMELSNPADTGERQRR